MVIGREWCRRPIDSRIYTAENWRPLIEHTICRSWPQVIRHPPPPPTPAIAYFAFVQRAQHLVAVCCFSRVAPRLVGRALSWELTLFSLYPLRYRCMLPMPIEFYQSPIKKEALIIVKFQARARGKNIVLYLKNIRKWYKFFYIGC